MTREDLLGVNAGIMKSVIGQAMEASPNAVFICVTNPLDVMTTLAFRESGLPANRLMGMGGVLDLLASGVRGVRAAGLRAGRRDRLGRGRARRGHGVLAALHHGGRHPHH